MAFLESQLRYQYAAVSCLNGVTDFTDVSATFVWDETHEHSQSYISWQYLLASDELFSGVTVWTLLILDNLYIVTT